MSELSLERTSQDRRMQGQRPFGQAYLIQAGPCARTPMAAWEVNLLSYFQSKELVFCGLKTSIYCCFLGCFGTSWSRLATVNQDPPVHHEG
jgi:hypothetical protein